MTSDPCVTWTCIDPAPEREKPPKNGRESSRIATGHCFLEMFEVSDVILSPTHEKQPPLDLGPPDLDLTLLERVRHQVKDPEIFNGIPEISAKDECRAVQHPISRGLCHRYLSTASLKKILDKQLPTYSEEWKTKLYNLPARFNIV
ncbi:hypothetical protein CDAR_271421 [Caerostris darwini]|uniref:Uncharacterized protein n=1 Tax=Caerostris darwini TaxID=1538125 RepID=A0AAV4SZ10_9ARAC|nr:hypothetical protein CDAR_271421 [Caerostris darwini]